MDLHPGERVLFEGHPSWRSVLGFYLVGFVAAVAVGVVMALVVGTGTGVAAFLVAFAILVVVGLLKRIGTRYTITSQRLHIRRGILSRSVQQTRLERVQNVNTEQSVLQRLLRVGTVDFDTAGTDDSDFVFAGVADPESVVRAVDDAQRDDGAALERPVR